MVPATVLNIRLTSVLLKPKVGTTRLNELHGGPEALLNWLERQLGLIGPEVPRANRITDLANTLDGVADAVFAGIALRRHGCGLRYECVRLKSITA